jgi:hypothetical protein
VPTLAGDPQAVHRDGARRLHRRRADARLGVEYFAHPWVLGPRFAKEVLFTGGRFGAERGMRDQK